MATQSSEELSSVSPAPSAPESEPSPGPHPDLELWINDDGTNNAACGLSEATACASHLYLMTGNNACGPNGCEDLMELSLRPLVHVAQGTYNEAWRLPWDGTSANPVTYRCDDPGLCVISGAGVTSTCSVVCFGCEVDSCNSNAATFIQFDGFVIQDMGNSNGVLFGGGPSTHDIRIEDTTIDGAGSSNTYAVGAVTGVSRVTFVRSPVINCSAGAMGCIYGEFGSQVAFVNAASGPLHSFPVATNSDCITLTDTVGFLIDGLTVRGCTDGIDIGQLSSPALLSNGIIRFNYVKDIRSSDGQNERLLKISGNHAIDWSQDFAIYRNVFSHNGQSQANGPSFMESTRRVALDRNTVFNYEARQGQAVWLYQDSFNYPVTDIHIVDNIFDSNEASTSTGFLSSEKNTSTNVHCPESNPCPLLGNLWWVPNANPDHTAVRWEQSDASNASYSYSQLGDASSCESGTLNSAQSEHSCNFRTNPRFINRADPTQISNLRLAGDSPAIDRATPFCTAVGGGTGTTITVSCRGPGSRGAKLWFPDPANFYDLRNNDCKGGGARAQSSTNPGCYDLQIEGACGVRQAIAVTTTTIHFSGEACTWSNGAAVDLPWSGEGPDLGGLESH